MKKIIGILGVVVFTITLFLSSNSLTELDVASAGVGSNKCVCKMNQNNRCLASNFISFRTPCANGATDSECERAQPVHDIGGPTTHCEIHN